MMLATWTVDNKTKVEDRWRGAIELSWEQMQHLSLLQKKVIAKGPGHIL